MSRSEGNEQRSVVINPNTIKLGFIKLIGAEPRIPIPEMDLEKAKKTLRELVQMDEQSEEMLTRFLEKHNEVEIIRALLTVTFDLFLRLPYKISFHPALKKHCQGHSISLCYSGHISMEVYDPEGEKILHQSYSIFPQVSSDGNYESWFFYGRNGKYIMYVNSDTVTDESGYERYGSRYDKRFYASPPPLTKKEQQDIIFGIRWYAINLLAWETDVIIMPEELPHAEKRFTKLNLTARRARNNY